LFSFQIENYINIEMS